MGHTAPVTDRREMVLVDRRPWGHFRQYATQEACTVKLITVEAGQQLSLQRHRNRDELWVSLDEGLLVTVGQHTVEAEPGDEFFIPRGVVHRAAGGPAGGRFVEVCFGVFDEGDIERIEDDYGRVGS